MDSSGDLVNDSLLVSHFYSSGGLISALNPFREGRHVWQLRKFILRFAATMAELMDQSPLYLPHPPQLAQLATNDATGLEGNSFQPPTHTTVKTLLEYDILRAVGDVVLNERCWWADHDESTVVWKRKEGEIASRVVRATFQDAAAHILNWLAPLARQIAEEVPTDDLRLSLLVTQWPIQFGDKTSFLISGSPLQFLDTFENVHPEQSDPYLVLAWTMLRAICKADAAEWPPGWGVVSCPCSNLRLLVEAVGKRCVDAMQCLDTIREHGLDIDQGDIASVVLGGDDSATEWLETALFTSAGQVLEDVNMVKMWATRRVQTIIRDYQPESESQNRLVVAPAPFPTSFLADGVEMHTLPATCVVQKTVQVECEADIEGDKVTKTTVFGDRGRELENVELSSLLSSLVPVLKAAVAAKDSTPSCIIHLASEKNTRPRFIQMPQRPTISMSDHNGTRAPATEADANTWTSKRFIITTETITLEANNESRDTGKWAHNYSEMLDGVDIEASVLICIEQSNCTAPPDIQVKALSRQPIAEPSDASTRELYVRSAMSSSCSDANAGIFQVSMFPDRIVVLPPGTQHRFTRPPRSDPSKPGGFVALRIALVGPTSRRTRESIMCMMREAPDTQAWSHELHLASTDQNWSPEEVRYQHYQQNRVPDLRERICWLEWSPPDPQPTKLPASLRREHGDLERVVLEKVVELMNHSRWWEAHWAEGSDLRQEWELQVENLYVQERLRLEIAEQHASMVAALGDQAKDPSVMASGALLVDIPLDAKNEKDRDTFARLVAIFMRVIILRELYQGLVRCDTNGGDPASPQTVADLVNQCRLAAGSEARNQIVHAFLGASFPAETVFTALNRAWKHVDDDVSFWMSEFVGFMDSLPRVPHPNDRDIFLRVPSCSLVLRPIVRDGIVALNVKTSFLAKLEPLRRDARKIVPSASTSAFGFGLGLGLDSEPQSSVKANPPPRRLLDPRAYVEPSQTVPRFSAPRTGSVEERLAAIIVQSQPTSRPDHKYSTQWIPSDVAVDGDGRVRFLSYISNLFPRHHGSLHKSLEQIATAFVPLFEQVVSSFVLGNELATSAVVGSIDSPLIDGSPQSSHWFSLRGRVVQMAVEIIEIELTPDQPRHSGEAWHSCVHKPSFHFPRPTKEDKASNVIATAMYFAAADNVTQPRVSFRASKNPQSPVVVDSSMDRCLVYSDKWEHRIEAMELVDASKPGSLLLVKFHLVDPNVLLKSTANIRPPRREWVVDYTLGDVARFFGLPSEVHKNIESMLEWEGVGIHGSPEGFSINPRAPTFYQYSCFDPKPVWWR